MRNWLYIACLTLVSMNAFAKTPLPGPEVQDSAITAYAAGEYAKALEFFKQIDNRIWISRFDHGFDGFNTFLDPVFVDPDHQVHFATIARKGIEIRTNVPNSVDQWNRLDDANDAEGRIPFKCPHSLAGHVERLTYSLLRCRISQRLGVGGVDDGWKIAIIVVRIGLPVTVLLWVIQTTGEQLRTICLEEVIADV